MIGFKYLQTVDEWAGCHATLRAVLRWLAGQWPDEVMVVTRISWPPVPGESGVHQTEPHRAADIRTTTIPYAVAKKLADSVNAAWRYGSSDPAKQVALYHRVPGGAYHLHIQVRDETAAITGVTA